jgi:mRNA interferase RelE/StbE
MVTGSKGSPTHLIKYEIEFKESAKKSLQKFPKKIQKRIQGVITVLETNPLPPIAEKLKGRDAYRIRVSDYRIIYSIENNKLLIVVVAIGHRREIYRA